MPLDRDPDAPLEMSLPGLRVLAVDDDLDGLELTAAVLRLCGATVRTARSAYEARALLTLWRPHVILSDLEMPEGDGYELIARVRELPGSLPVIAITAHSQAQDRARALAAGFTGFIGKPFDPLALVAALVDIRPPAGPANWRTLGES